VDPRQAHQGTDELVQLPESGFTFFFLSPAPAPFQSSTLERFLRERYPQEQWVRHLRSSSSARRPRSLWTCFLLYFLFLPQDVVRASIIANGQEVPVEEACAMTTRVSPSFIRVGHFDLFGRCTALFFIF
jgi:hypothetical protein